MSIGRKAADGACTLIAIVPILTIDSMMNS